MSTGPLRGQNTKARAGAALGAVSPPGPSRVGAAKPPRRWIPGARARRRACEAYTKLRAHGAPHNRASFPRPATSDPRKLFRPSAPELGDAAKGGGSAQTDRIFFDDTERAGRGVAPPPGQGRCPTTVRECPGMSGGCPGGPGEGPGLGLRCRQKNAIAFAHSHHPECHPQARAWWWGAPLSSCRVASPKCGGPRSFPRGNFSDAGQSSRGRGHKTSHRGRV